MLPTLLITGAAGYIGTELIKRLSENDLVGEIIALDIRPVAQEDRIVGVTYDQADIRSDEFTDKIKKYKPRSIVHLASVVSAGGDPELDYSVDVLGTHNVLKACVASGVKQLVVTSSGAAYGYYADNPSWLKETDALRGNDDFPYPRHKRLVEELLAGYRETHPELKQLVLRPGTVLGAATNNQITNLFAKPFMLKIAKSRSGFVFIWDEDVISIIEKGVLEDKEGIYNLAGTGSLSANEIAQILNKPCLVLPASVLGAVLNISRFLKLGKLGSEHVKFLQYRPVLDNQSLREDFGYTPKKTTREVFDFFIANRNKRGE
ncbi:MAG: epimerase [Robiginitomaculum sp.]|nr:MAG: epimerase [Robiginitomaculum sp.]